MKRDLLSNDMIKNLTEKIGERMWSRPSLSQITFAASLAYHNHCGLLGSIHLADVDLSSVPPEHLGSLASTVSTRLGIYNVSGSGLASILGNVRSKVLLIWRQSLDTEETKTLVKSMEADGGRLTLVMYGGDVIVAIKRLTQYSGEGRCSDVRFYGDRYRKELRKWAKKKNWRVVVDGDRDFIMRRQAPTGNGSDSDSSNEYGCFGY